jgi:hypothetical protein
MEANIKPRSAGDDRQNRDRVRGESRGQLKEAFGSVGGDKTLALVALILGIVSILFGTTIVGGLGAGIAAIILGVKYRKQKIANGNGMALAGIICGAVGSFIGLIAFIMFVLFGSFFFSTFNNIQNARDNIKDSTKGIINQAGDSKNKPDNKTEDAKPSEVEDENKAEAETPSTPNAEAPAADAAYCSSLKTALDNARSAHTQSQNTYNSMKDRLPADMLATYEAAMARTQAALDTAQANYNARCN